MASKARYDCTRCPGYCCSYELIDVSEHDLARLAGHLGVRLRDAWRRFTKLDSGRRVLRHRRDTIYRSTCLFFDQQERRCTVYEARPRVCRQYPEARCGYYDFLRFERKQQADDEFVPGTPRSAQGARLAVGVHSEGEEKPSGARDRSPEPAARRRPATPLARPRPASPPRDPHRA